MFVYPISCKSTHSNYDKPENVSKRIKTMAVGTLLGTATSALYYSNKKNYTGKKLLLRSLETGAAIGLLADIIGLAVGIPKNVKNKVSFKGNSSISEDELTPYQNKDFFISLYSGQKTDNKEFEQFQKRLENKEFCNKVFQNKKVLLASQEALRELIPQKITEAKQNGDKKL